MKREEMCGRSKTFRSTLMVKFKNANVSFAEQI